MPKDSRVKVQISEAAEAMLAELADRFPFATRPQLSRFALDHGFHLMLNCPTLLPATLGRMVA